MAKKSTFQSKQECRHSLSTELAKCAEQLLELENAQMDGDFSIEMSRKISILSYHMEVLENRLNGNFEASYLHEFSPGPKIF